MSGKISEFAFYVKPLVLLCAFYTYHIHKYAKEEEELLWDTLGRLIIMLFFLCYGLFILWSLYFGAYKGFNTTTSAAAKSTEKVGCVHDNDGTKSHHHGGELVARVLQEAGIKRIFTLVGGHVSPILVSCESLGISVIDMRHEATAVFAADATARLAGSSTTGTAATQQQQPAVGVAVVTAGPGVTNAVTPIANAKLAESPVLLLGGATATLLRGRGALQDIDQTNVLRPLCKRIFSVHNVKSIIPTMREAIQVASSGTPGPVFVELPVDTLYPYEMVKKEIGSTSGSSGKKQSLMNCIVQTYLNYHLQCLFDGASWDDKSLDTSPLPSKFPMPTTRHLCAGAGIIKKSQRPLILVGSQAALPPVSIDKVQSTLETLGIPCFLSGMSRGLLGKDSSIQIRHKRRDALKESDVVILLGTTCDFRLGYGKVLPKRHNGSKIIAINRGREQLYRNSSLFWKPSLAILADPASTLIGLVERLVEDKFTCDPAWLQKLKERDNERDMEIIANAQTSDDASSPLELNDKHKHPHNHNIGTNKVNPICLLQALEKVLPENSILVADGGDFVATASYVLKPRKPLSWIDPGPYGTLGVGGGFALGAKLAKPDAEVWIIYGDGSLGFSMPEFDTFRRFNAPVITLVGNDACWSQIAREQIPVFGKDTACGLEYTMYHEVVEGFGGTKGILLDGSNAHNIEYVLQEARRIYREEKKSVLINAMIEQSDFRKGSISI
mmetsp:Transcript_20666/g.30235  ORF Transcript_20666/g.30235 Transcript_20666/m.30235 type:complete len:726 (+) Transcript_20666:118-2295(+)